MLSAEAIACVACCGGGCDVIASCARTTRGPSNNSSEEENCFHSMILWPNPRQSDAGWQLEIRMTIEWTRRDPFNAQHLRVGAAF